jgi:hypothetical protein
MSMSNGFDRVIKSISETHELVICAKGDYWSESSLLGFSGSSHFIKGSV